MSKAAKKSAKPAPKAPAKAAAAKAPSKLATIKNALFGGKQAKGAAPAAAAHAKKAAPAPTAAAGKKNAAPAAPAKPSAPATLPGRKPQAAKRAAPAARVASADDCREVACEGLATTVGYCRMHYIKNWKKIKRKELILKEGKLNQYIEELVLKYPDKYIEAIRQDLSAEKDFAKVIYDLDLDESVDDFDVDGESLDGIVGDIKQGFDDESDSGF